MNILRLSTLSMTLAIAVITLGVGANGWAAPGECSGPKDARPESCNASSDPSETTFTVNIDVDSISTMNGPAMCMGTTEMGLDVGFGLNDCHVTLDDEGGPFEVDPPRDYCLFAADVKNTRKETSVMFFFHSPCGDHPGTGVWRTLRLPATLAGGPPGDFTVTVDSPFDVVLTKNHQPFKEVSLTDRISVKDGEIVYTAP